MKDSPMDSYSKRPCPDPAGNESQRPSIGKYYFREKTKPVIPKISQKAEVPLSKAAPMEESDQEDPIFEEEYDENFEDSCSDEISDDADYDSVIKKSIGPKAGKKPEQCTIRKDVPSENKMHMVLSHMDYGNMVEIPGSPISTEKKNLEINEAKLILEAVRECLIKQRANWNAINLVDENGDAPEEIKAKYKSKMTKDFQDCAEYGSIH